MRRIGLSFSSSSGILVHTSNFGDFMSTFFERYTIFFQISVSAFFIMHLSAIGIALSDENSKPALAYAEDSRANGQFCISGSDVEAVNALSKLKSLGVDAKLLDLEEIPCSTKHAISFPDGIERWVREQLNHLGIETTNPQYASAGSAIFRADLETLDILSDVPDPQNLSSLRLELDCKIKSRLSKSLIRIASSSCEGGAGGLCYEYQLIGHTGASDLFNPSSFNRMVDDKFWFRIKASFLFGDHGDDGSGRKTMTAIAVVQETRLSRQPLSSGEPESGNYMYLNQFYPDRDNGELDDLGNNILAKSVFSRQNTCEDQQ